MNYKITYYESDELLHRYVRQKTMVEALQEFMDSKNSQRYKPTILKIELVSEEQD